MPASTAADNHSSQRASLRRQFRQQRRALSPTQRRLAALNLVKNLRQSRHFQHSQHIAVYLTNDGEIDTQYLIRDLRARGKTLYLPVLHPFRKGHLSFVRWCENTLMQYNKFGIPEPVWQPENTLSTQFIQLVCMPLVAFDEHGNRLGMGGGFYDRTLAFMRNSVQQPALIGLAYELQKVAQLPIEPWDVPLTAIATEQQLYRF